METYKKKLKFNDLIIIGSIAIFIIMLCYCIKLLVEQSKKIKELEENENKIKEHIQENNRRINLHFTKINEKINDTYKPVFNSKQTNEEEIMKNLAKGYLEDDD